MLASAEKRISIDYLRATLDCDYSTGILRWRKNGKIAGWKEKNGYVRVEFPGRVKVLAHRVVWAHFRGEWPVSRIDHDDKTRDHNWIDNLREATDSQNAWNNRVRKNNKSGVPGAKWLPKRGHYQCYVTAHYKKHFVGCFKDLSEAEREIAAARARLHGDFAR